MHFTDTHTHLFLPEFDTDREAVVRAAIRAGVDKIYLPNVDVDTIEPMLQLCNQFSGNCFPLIALHPEGVKEDFEKKLKVIESELQKGIYSGIGETGIDLYWDTTFREQQILSFEKHLSWGIEFKLPVIIHQRSSYHEIINSVKNYTHSNLRGIFHCFTGTLEQAFEIIELGFFIGIGGIVTFKNAGLDKVVKEIPLEKIVLETDSPYLAPVPKRGKRNESSNLPYIARKIAEIKDIPVEEVAGITTQNAGLVFNEE